MDPATLESLIVKEIRKASEISRRDLSERLDIAKSTAGRRVDSMIERGILREKGLETRTEVGRPRRFLELRGSHGGFVGFDFEARNLYAVFVDFAQHTLARVHVRLSERPAKEEVVGQLRRLIAEFSANDRNLDIHGVGIGAPGRIHQESRLGVSYPFIAGWRNVTLPSELGLPPARVHVENNTRAIILGEYWLGSHGACEHMICLNVRTGISAAVIANGQLLSGRHEMAGEIRGWPVPAEAGAGNRENWLENVATVRAISKDRSPTRERWRAFVEKCRTGDGRSIELLARIARHHGDTAARLVQLTDPEVVLFAGAFTELGDLYLDRVRETAAALLEDHYFRPPPIKLVTLGEFAGAHGAAALAAAHYKPALG
ncbi:MAG: ROK family transcriptional regulator [Verrucomicrobiales bacterium]